MLKYSAVENEAWDRTQNRVVMDPWQLFSLQVFSPLHGKEDLTTTAVGNPENSKGRKTVKINYLQGKNKGANFGAKLFP